MALHNLLVFFGAKRTLYLAFGYIRCFHNNSAMSQSIIMEGMVIIDRTMRNKSIENGFVCEKGFDSQA